MTAPGSGPVPGGAVREIVIPGDPQLAAILGVPDAAKGLVIFAHGSGSGRPDLAGKPALAQVAAPTLLIVGELDGIVIDLNAQAQQAMTCECEMTIVPGAGHLFEEPGTLDVVVTQACDWFLRHLGA